MKQELEQKLVKKYPGFFRDKNKSPRESLICFGCECGDGWYGVLDNLLGFLSSERESRTKTLRLRPDLATEKNGGYFDFRCPPVVLDQVKEKYGTLRVYWHFDLSELESVEPTLYDPCELDQSVEASRYMVDAAVDFAEFLSSKTCELTGRPGRLYSEGWMVTLCEEEAIKRFGYLPDPSRSSQD